MEGLVKLTPDENLGREVLVLRHGQTLLNAQDKIRGWSDVPLDEIGIEQAHNLGEALLNEGVELDGLFTSDLQRSIQTSIIISTITGIPILGITKDLRPLDVGDLTGTDGKKAHAIISEFSRNKPDDKIGGGESFNTFRHRFIGGFISRLNSHRGLKLGFCSHSRGERILHGWVAAGCRNDLDIDLNVFLSKGEEPATAQQLFIESNLVLP